MNTLYIICSPDASEYDKEKIHEIEVKAKKCGVNVVKANTYDYIMKEFNSETLPFKVRVKIDNLLIRKKPSKSADKVRIIEKGIFTITEINNGYGKLKSGIGWISLDEKYVERV